MQSKFEERITNRYHHSIAFQNTHTSNISNHSQTHDVHMRCCWRRRSDKVWKKYANTRAILFITKNHLGNTFVVVLWKRSEQLFRFWVWPFFEEFLSPQTTGKNTYFNVNAAHPIQNTTKVISLDVKNRAESKNIFFLDFFWWCERSARFYSTPTAGSTGRKFFVKDARRIFSLTLHWIKIKRQKWYHRIQNLLLYTTIWYMSAVIHKIYVREY